MLRHLRAALPIASLLFISAQLSAQQQKPLDSFDLDHAHVMLHQAYKDVEKNYYDPKFHGVDLEATYHQFDSRLNNAHSVGETYRIIAAFLDKLHDSHTFFHPPSRVNASTIGYQMQMIGDKCFVTRVRPDTDAATKLHPGDELVHVDGYSVNRIDLFNLSYFLNVLAPAPAEQLDLLSPSGKISQQTVSAKIHEGKADMDISEGHRKSVLLRENANEREAWRDFEIGDTLIVNAPGFIVAPESLDPLIVRARRHKALVLDLRGNPGGYIVTLKALISDVFDHDVKLGDTVTRKKTTTEIVKPNGTPFTGKLIVLIDSDSASAAELFARVVQLEHRGQVIGDRSSGKVMEALYHPESLGLDTKMFYGFEITEANLLMSDGKSLEDTGVIPDELVLPTADDLAAGRDPVLAHAVSLTGATLDPIAAGKLFPYQWAPLD